MPTTSTTSQTPSISNLESFSNLGALRKEPSILFSILLLVLLVGVQIFYKPKRKQSLATGRFATSHHIDNARREALLQMQKREKNAASIFLGRPKDNKSPLFLPSMQQGSAIIGGPGCGKTASFFVPAIISWIEQGYPAIIYDFKYPTLSKRFASHAQELGYRVSIFAPGYPESQRCNPIDFIKGPEDGLMAGQFAQTLTRNFSRNQGKAGDKFFEEAGDTLLQGIFLLSKLLPVQMQDLISCQVLLGLDRLPQRLEANRDRIDPWVFTNFTQLIQVKDSEKTLAGIIATALNTIQSLMKSQLIYTLVGETTINLDLEGKNLLIIGLDRENRDVLTPLIAAILDLIVSRSVAYSRKTPLGLFLDEVPTLYLPRLKSWLNECREDGLCSFLGFQVLSQMIEAYGNDGLQTIMAGCATKLFFNPQDIRSAREVSDYLGELELNYGKTSYTRGRELSRTTNTEERTRLLIQPNELLKYPRGRAIVINPGISDQNECYIPLNHQFNLSPKHFGLVERNEANWDSFLEYYLLQKSLSESDQITREDLAEYRRYIEAEFPITSENT